MLLQTVLCTSKVSLACRIFSQICSFTLRGAGWVINILCLTSPPSLPNSALPTKLLFGVQTKLDVLVVLQPRIECLQHGGALSWPVGPFRWGSRVPWTMKLSLFIFVDCEDVVDMPCFNFSPCPLSSHFIIKLKPEKVLHPIIRKVQQVSYFDQLLLYISVSNLFLRHAISSYKWYYYFFFQVYRFTVRQHSIGG